MVTGMSLSTLIGQHASACHVEPTGPGVRNPPPHMYEATPHHTHLTRNKTLRSIPGQPWAVLYPRPQVFTVLFQPTSLINHGGGGPLLPAVWPPLLPLIPAPAPSSTKAAYHSTFITPHSTHTNNWTECTVRQHTITRSTNNIEQQ